MVGGLYFWSFPVCSFVTNLPSELVDSCVVFGGCKSFQLIIIQSLFFSKRAMDIVGFSQDEKQSIYTLLSAILNLGNVTFSAVFDKSSGHNIHDSVTLTNEKCKLSK